MRPEIRRWYRRELAAIRERARSDAELQGEPGRILVIADRDFLLEYIHDLEAALAEKPGQEQGS